MQVTSLSQQVTALTDKVARLETTVLEKERLISKMEEQLRNNYADVTSREQAVRDELAASKAAMERLAAEKAQLKSHLAKTVALAKVSGHMPQRSSSLRTGIDPDNATRVRHAFSSSQS